MDSHVRLLKISLALPLAGLALAGCGQVKFSADTASMDAIYGDGDGSGHRELVIRDVSGSILVSGQRKVDIIVVADNSGSMETEQATMAASFPSFADVLNDPAKALDWQLGVVTTDVSGSGNGEDGNLLPLKNVSPTTYVLNKDTANGNDVFKNTVQQSNSGSSDERGIYAAYRVIEKTGTSMDRGLIRSDSHLALVILSDEDERSAGGDPNVGQYHPLEEKDKPDVFINYLKSRFPQKSLSTHAIVIRPGDTACHAMENDDNQLGTGGKYGVVYKAFVDLTTSIFGTSGILGNICDTNYQQQLQDIGTSIQNSVDTYPLECVPYQGIVTLDSSSNPTAALTLIGGAVKITPQPLPGDTFSFHYQCAEWKTVP